MKPEYDYKRPGPLSKGGLGLSKKWAIVQALERIAKKRKQGARHSGKPRTKRGK